ncbi:hypothetical protein, partial [Escherichia coli]|uniref:hypothetical protein n=1 Tax=Escherichia coli TaxID=562 RepID=UPI001BC89E56
VSIKNDGHYFCRAGGNRPDGLNEPVTFYVSHLALRTVGNIVGGGCVSVHCFLLTPPWRLQSICKSGKSRTRLVSSKKVWTVCYVVKLKSEKGLHRQSQSRWLI